MVIMSTSEAAAAPAAGPSAPSGEARIDELVLDAGPLLTQQQGLARLAKKYYITPLVVAELRDKRARDHFEWLQSDAGGRCHVEVREPTAEARVAVTAFARQTGDYSVLSQADMSVLALAYTLEVQRHGTWRIRDKVGGPTGQQASVAAQKEESKGMQQQKQGGKRKEKKEAAAAAAAAAAAKEQEGADDQIDEVTAEDDIQSGPVGSADTNGERILEEQVGEEEDTAGEQAVVQGAQWDESVNTDDDDDDEDDEEEGGQWITPENIDAHKSRSLGLVSDADVVSFGTASGSKKNNFEGHVRTTNSHADEEGWSTVVAVPKSNARQDSSESSKRGKQAAAKAGPITVACLTGDYAVQNVMLQMGLNLVGLEGHKIKQVRAWVLRCHACFKICKDSERTFCPQCGNATLIRTSVTSSGDGGNGHVQVHLKKNFQYKNRGTKYSLPLPKAGKAAGAAASVPILREDQPEWQRAVARERVQRQKQERSLQRALERGTDSISAHYEDADGLSILLAGKNASRQSHGLPALGVGRGNPNERRRRKV